MAYLKRKQIDTKEPLIVTSGNGNDVFRVDESGNAYIKRLILQDEVTGKNWEIKLRDGELSAEPLDLQDKREWKIGKVID